MIKAVMVSAVDLFQRDVETVMCKMKGELDEEEYTKMLVLKERLLHLSSNNLVKINHSVMELVCAKHFIQRGFEVELEHDLDKVSCDIYALKGYGTVIVEVETGFVPPEHALDPIMYLRARIASKITRYSGSSNKFMLATPPYYIMQIPSTLTKPPRFRSVEEVTAIKRLCDTYYKSPPITFEEVRNARLHSIFTLDVDNVSVTEWDLSEYLGKVTLWST